MWISEETLSRVFDLASQMNNDSWRNSKTKFAKFYGNLIVSDIQTTVVVVIFFVYSLRIINEFEKIVFMVANGCLLQRVIGEQAKNKDRKG